MLRAALGDCVPWLVWLCAAAAVGWLLVRAGGGRWRWRRLVRLHGDQRGAVQSLSFVLTMPLFVLVVLFIIQMSQLMIGTFTVHYAAYAAARSAIVWIPADTPWPEHANCISAVTPVREVAGYGTEYFVAPGSPKFEKIRFAAALACMAVCPSRDLGYDAQGIPVDALQRLYLCLDADAAENRRVPQRLRNKIAYSLANTAVEIRFLHPDTDPPHREPPLQRYWLLHDPSEFNPNELGWQDQITVTVRHKFALLPGPGRFLANAAAGSLNLPESLRPRVQQQGSVYVRELTATCTLGNEGEKPVLPYRRSLRGESVAVTVPPDYAHSWSPDASP